MAGVIPLLVALLVSVLVCALMVRFGPRDHPTARSSHVRATATAGGVGVLSGLLAADIYVNGFGHHLILLILAAVLGLVDDLRPLPPRRKLALQTLLVSLAAVVLGPVSELNLLGAVLTLPPFLAYGLTLFGGVAVLNAVNFMDGADGMAIGVVGVTLAAMALTGGGVWSLLLVAALCGFAPFNLTKRLFLGDCGAHLLGMAVVILAVTKPHSTQHISLLAFGLMPFLVDTAATLLVRYRAKAAFWYAHKEHLYQRLIQGGWSHLHASGVYTLIALAGIAVGCVVPVAWAAPGLLIWLGLVLCVWCYARRWAQYRASAQSGS